MSVDAYHYFGTDDLYLGYMAHFLNEGGRIAMVAPGLVSEIGSKIPEELIPFWAWDFCSFHSPEWWREHGKDGKVHVDLADLLEDGWKDWLIFGEAKRPRPVIARGKWRQMKWPCFRLIGARTGLQPDRCHEGIATEVSTEAPKRSDLHSSSERAHLRRTVRNSAAGHARKGDARSRPRIAVSMRVLSWNIARPHS